MPPAAGDQLERDGLLSGAQRNPAHTQGGHQDDPPHGPSVSHPFVSYCIVKRERVTEPVQCF